MKNEREGDFKMLFNRAEMLNRRASNPKYKMNEIIKVIPLRKGAVVADIGSGGGCFTMRFAEKVRLDGKVVIIDYKKRAVLNFITLMGHYVEESLIQETMKNTGYKLVERYDFLSEQSFNIFQLI